MSKQQFPTVRHPDDTCAAVGPSAIWSQFIDRWSKHRWLTTVKALNFSPEKLALSLPWHDDLFHVCLILIYHKPLAQRINSHRQCSHEAKHLCQTDGREKQILGFCVRYRFVTWRVGHSSFPIRDIFTVQESTKTYLRQGQKPVSSRSTLHTNSCQSFFFVRFCKTLIPQIPYDTQSISESNRKFLLHAPSDGKRPTRMHPPDIRHNPCMRPPDISGSKSLGHARFQPINQQSLFIGTQPDLTQLRQKEQVLSCPRLAWGPPSEK